MSEAALHDLYKSVCRDPEIVSMGELRLIGMELRSLDSEQISELWTTFRKRVPEMVGGSSHEYYALIELTGMEWETSYTACIKINGNKDLPDGMVEKRLPPATYAVFRHQGTIAKIQETFQYIYCVWMPKSGRTRMNLPEFARYGEGYLGPWDEHSELDIFIPVVPSERKSKGERSE